eukprot:GHVT01104363.1.p1 GENE.GHVT01104363.1~~GHVT01104363.1.p1  ORF type:complete len:1995 (+),score=259.78 GHVT01104363.1:542-6526(+)
MGHRVVDRSFLEDSRPAAFPQHVAALWEAHLKRAKMDPSCPASTLMSTPSMESLDSKTTESRTQRRAVSANTSPRNLSVLASSGRQLKSPAVNSFQQHVTPTSSSSSSGTAVEKTVNRLLSSSCSAVVPDEAKNLVTKDQALDASILQTWRSSFSPLASATRGASCDFLTEKARPFAEVSLPSMSCFPNGSPVLALPPCDAVDECSPCIDISTIPEPPLYPPPMMASLQSLKPPQPWRWPLNQHVASPATREDDWKLSHPNATLGGHILRCRSEQHQFVSQSDANAYRTNSALFEWPPSNNSVKQRNIDGGSSASRLASASVECPISASLTTASAVSAGVETKRIPQNDSARLLPSIFLSPKASAVVDPTTSARSPVARSRNDEINEPCPRLDAAIPREYVEAPTSPARQIALGFGGQPEGCFSLGLVRQPVRATRVTPAKCSVIPLTDVAHLTQDRAAPLDCSKSIAVGATLQKDVREHRRVSLFWPGANVRSLTATERSAPTGAEFDQLPKGGKLRVDAPEFISLLGRQPGVAEAARVPSERLSSASNSQHSTTFSVSSGGSSSSKARSSAKLVGSFGLSESANYSRQAHLRVNEMPHCFEPLSTAADNADSCSLWTARPKRARDEDAEETQDKAASEAQAAGPTATNEINGHKREVEIAHADSLNRSPPEAVTPGQNFVRAPTPIRTRISANAADLPAHLCKPAAVPCASSYRVAAKSTGIEDSMVRPWQLKPEIQRTQTAAVACTTKPPASVCMTGLAQIASLDKSGQWSETASKQQLTGCQDQASEPYARRDRPPRATRRRGPSPMPGERLSPESNWRERPHNPAQAEYCNRTSSNREKSPISEAVSPTLHTVPNWLLLLAVYPKLCPEWQRFEASRKNFVRDAEVLRNCLANQVSQLTTKLEAAASTLEAAAMAESCRGAETMNTWQADFNQMSQCQRKIEAMEYEQDQKIFDIVRTALSQVERYLTVVQPAPHHEVNTKPMPQPVQTNTPRSKITNRSRPLGQQVFPESECARTAGVTKQHNGPRPTTRHEPLPAPSRRFAVPVAAYIRPNFLTQRAYGRQRVCAQLPPEQPANVSFPLSIRPASDTRNVCHLSTTPLRLTANQQPVFPSAAELSTGLSTNRRCPSSISTIGSVLEKAPQQRAQASNVPRCSSLPRRPLPSKSTAQDNALLRLGLICCNSLAEARRFIADGRTWAQSFNSMFHQSSVVYTANVPAVLTEKDASASGRRQRPKAMRSHSVPPTELQHRRPTAFTGKPSVPATGRDGPDASCWSHTPDALRSRGSLYREVPAGLDKRPPGVENQSGAKLTAALGVCEVSDQKAPQEDLLWASKYPAGSERKNVKKGPSDTVNPQLMQLVLMLQEKKEKAVEADDEMKKILRHGQKRVPRKVWKKMLSDIDLLNQEIKDVEEELKRTVEAESDKIPTQAVAHSKLNKKEMKKATKEEQKFARKQRIEETRLAKEIERKSKIRSSKEAHVVAVFQPLPQQELHARSTRQKLGETQEHFDNKAHQIPKEQLDNLPHEEQQLDSQLQEESDNRLQEELEKEQKKESNRQPKEQSQVQLDKSPQKQSTKLPEEELKKHPVVLSDGSPHKELDKQPQEELAKQPQEELEKPPQDELKKQPEEELEKQPQEELEKQPQDKQEKQPQEELKKHPQDELKKHPEEELEKQPQEELEKQPQDEQPEKELDKQPQEELEKQPEEELEKQPYEQSGGLPQEALDKQLEKQTDCPPQEELKNPPQKVLKKQLQEKLIKQPQEKLDRPPLQQSLPQKALTKIGVGRNGAIMVDDLPCLPFIVAFDDFVFAVRPGENTPVAKSVPSSKRRRARNKMADEFTADFIHIVGQSANVLQYVHALCDAIHDACENECATDLDLMAGLCRKLQAQCDNPKETSSDLKIVCNRVQKRREQRTQDIKPLMSQIKTYNDILINLQVTRLVYWPHPEPVRADEVGVTFPFTNEHIVRPSLPEETEMVNCLTDARSVSDVEMLK